MEYLTLLKQLEDYYANLLIVQYNCKPKATETIKLLVNLVYVNMILTQIRDGFTLESAEISITNYIDDIGITNAVVNKFIFQEQIDNKEGYYVFYYDGSNWKFNNSNVTLSTYGITITGTAAEGDTITIKYTPYTADGVQLDIIGEWVGISRDYIGSEVWGKRFFSYPAYNDTTNSLQQHGYSTYDTYRTADTVITPVYIVGTTDYASDWLSTTDGGSPLTPARRSFYQIKTEGDFYDQIYGWNGTQYVESVSGYVLTYADLQTSGAHLSDDDYRTVIGLKIIKNSINHTVGEIDKAIWEYFGGQVYTTWQPHEVIYHYPSSLTTIMNICKDKNVLPAPTGCKVTIGVI